MLFGNPLRHLKYVTASNKLLVASTVSWNLAFLFARGYHIRFLRTISFQLNFRAKIGYKVLRNRFHKRIQGPFKHL